MADINDINEFLHNIEENFEPELSGTFKPQTRFKELEDWNSMQALIVIAQLDELYNVTIDANDLKSCQTLEDLHGLIVTKTA